MSANPEASPAFQHVCDMETPLTTVADLLRALGMISETLDVDEGGVVQRLAGLAMLECKKVEALRGELFKLSHPARAHFEGVGWPA